MKIVMPMFVLFLSLASPFTRAEEGPLELKDPQAQAGVENQIFARDGKNGIGFPQYAGAREGFGNETLPGHQVATIKAWARPR